MIGPRSTISERPHWVTFENPGAATPDGGGGYTEGAATTIGQAFVKLQPATGADQERITAGTVLSRQSFIVSAPYLAGLTTETVMVFADPRAAAPRRFSVMGVTDAEERGAEVTLICDEIQP